MKKNKVVRLSRVNDTDVILKTYLECTRKMCSQDIDQWSYNYPNIHNIEKDIRNQISYIIVEDGYAGVIVLDDKEDAQYAKLKWPYNSIKSLVIHRLAVHPKLQGKGVGKQLCLFAESVAKEKEYDSIKLDAYLTNKASNQLYIRLGYKQAEGFCFFHHNSQPFICFEKKIIYE